MEKQKKAMEKSSSNKHSFICHNPVENVCAKLYGCQASAHCPIFSLMFKVPIINNIEVEAIKLAAMTELRRVWMARMSILPLLMTISTQRSRILAFSVYTLESGAQRVRRPKYP